MEHPSSTSAALGRLDRQTLVALLEASKAINDALRPREVFRLVAQHAVEVFGAVGASVLLHDPAANELEFQAIAGESGSLTEGHRFPAERGIAGQVVKTRRAVRVDDVRDNTNFYPGIDKVTRQRTRSLMAAPLIHRDTILGVVEVVNRRDGGTFTDPDLELLQVFANLVAGAARDAETLDRLDRENRGLREAQPPVQFIGQAAAFARALDLCGTVAPTTTTVLLTGETGTGKEMAGRSIHAMSPRHDHPFIAVNCAAMPETLIESELFGHERGAFTGATAQKQGKFELADRGTLLLDEIGELDLALQAKLLRVLETREITRVGGAETVRCDVRIIAATNRDLKREAEAGRFREDLYYRIGVFPIALPPLRDRLDDLPLLIEHLIARVIPSLGTGPPAISAEAIECMRRYRWPGNVRELRNVVERAALLSSGTITPEHLPTEIAEATGAGPGGDGGAPDGASVLAESERRLVLEALETHNWNQSAAARQLGISRDILRARTKRYGLTPPKR